MTDGNGRRAGGWELFLDALAYELGEEARPVAELPNVAEDIREQLQQGGLRTYRVSSRTPIELARGPVTRTLAALDDEERARIKRVIFATNSFHDPSIATVREISRLLVDVGLGSAVPIGLFLSFCANLQSAIDVARGLLALEPGHAVLIICTDVRPRDEDRLVEPNISVLSDAAASLVLSPREGRYRVLDSRFQVESALGLLDRSTEFLEYMDGVSRGVTSVLGDTLAALELEPTEVARLLPANHTRWVCRAMAELAGFEESRLYLDNIPRVAHAFAADNVINLYDYEEAGNVRAGDLIALFGSGGFQWGCTLVEAR
jgi:3-oxoacyl-[acyl-carrier-protein] synthase III